MRDLYRNTENIAILNPYFESLFPKHHFSSSSFQGEEYIQTSEWILTNDQIRPETWWLLQAEQRGTTQLTYVEAGVAGMVNDDIVYYTHVFSVNNGSQPHFVGNVFPSLRPVLSPLPFPLVFTILQRRLVIGFPSPGAIERGSFFFKRRHCNSKRTHWWWSLRQGNLLILHGLPIVGTLDPAAVAPSEHFGTNVAFCWRSWQSSRQSLGFPWISWFPEKSRRLVLVILVQLSRILGCKLTDREFLALLGRQAWWSIMSWPESW